VGLAVEGLDYQADFLVCSIPHTGSAYVMSCIGGRFWPLSNQYPGPADVMSHKLPFPGGAIFGHLFDELLPSLVEIAQRVRTVVPLRHPVRVAASYYHRGYPLGTLTANWQKLCELPAGVLFFPVDADPPDFAQLAAYLGTSVRGDVSRSINSAGAYDTQLGVKWVKEAERVMEENSIARRFYTRTAGSAS